MRSQLPKRASLRYCIVYLWSYRMRNGPPLVTRRSFLKTSAAAAGTTLSLEAIDAPSIQSGPRADNRIRVGFIGVGNRGTQLLQGFMAQKDCQVAALCDVYEPYLTRDRAQVDPEILKSLEGLVPRMGEQFDSPVARYKDFRRLLEQKDLDAVVIATPDHWHAIQTIAALEAGKDVYVEKPLTVTIPEGRKMVRAERRYGRITQVGLHRRSSDLYRHIHTLLRQGKIGKVSVARAYRASNMFPNGIGKYPDAPPPKGLDWNMWLGPRAMRPYRYSIAPYKFRWWHDYSSQMGNWGVHYCDAMRWMLDEEAPVAVTAHGSKRLVDDDRTIPDTLEVTFEFASGRIFVFGQYEACASRPLASGEIEFCGTLGNLYPGAEARGCKIVPSGRGQFQNQEKGFEAQEIAAMDGDLTHQHIRNFLDCVKSRAKCNCDLETGHRSTTFAHLANLALATRSRLEWDAATERIINSEEANRLLDYEYRSPWNNAQSIP
jgi:predicted dehydrogenase